MAFLGILRTDSHATLSDDARARIGCDKTCTVINSCYGLYKAHRPGLFHASGIYRKYKTNY